jgi:hypothetical protein
MLVSSSCFDAPRALTDVIEYLLGLCRVSRRTELRIEVFEADKRRAGLGRGSIKELRAKTDGKLSDPTVITPELLLQEFQSLDRDGAEKLAFHDRLFRTGPELFD